MANLTTRQLLDNVSTLVSGVTALTELPELLDPREEPRTTLARGFSIDWSDTNSGKYRDRGDRSARLAYVITVRLGTQLVGGFAPLQEAVREAADYRDDIVQALCGATSSTIASMTVQYRQTRNTPTPSREWIITDITFDIMADLALS